MANLRNDKLAGGFAQTEESLGWTDRLYQQNQYRDQPVIVSSRLSLLTESDKNDSDFEEGRSNCIHKSIKTYASSKMTEKTKEEILLKRCNQLEGLLKLSQSVLVKRICNSQNIKMKQVLRRFKANTMPFMYYTQMTSPEHPGVTPRQKFKRHSRRPTDEDIAISCTSSN